MTHNLLTSDERRNRLVVYLGRLVHNGGEVEHHSPFRAIVRMRIRISIVPNVIMLVLGIVLWIALNGIAFLLGALVAVFGLYRKLADGASPRRLLVRVDELGEISELELEPASR